MGQEKVVVIGGSSGMGLASAKRLAAEGYHVVISARSPERIAQALKTQEAGCTGFVLDYADHANIKTFFDAVGSLDHLVLAGAGPSAWGAFNELEPAALERAFANKFWGYFHCLRAALVKSYCCWKKGDGMRWVMPPVRSVAGTRFAARFAVPRSV